MASDVAEFMRREGAGRVIEVGAGTGAITRALVDAVGSPALTVVEPDRGCCVYLRRNFPGARVIEGLVEDNLDQLLVPDGRLAVVSSVPLFSLTRPQRASVLAALEAIVGAASCARIVQFTYVPWLPEPRARSLFGGRVRPVWQNVPPAWIWSATHS